MPNYAVVRFEGNRHRVTWHGEARTPRAACSASSGVAEDQLRNSIAMDPEFRVYEFTMLTPPVTDDPIASAQSIMRHGHYTAAFKRRESRPNTP